MSGHGRVVVGYRDNDSRRGLIERFSNRSVPAGRCPECRHPVYVNDSGHKSLRDTDAVLVCANCVEQPGFRETM